MEAVLSYLPATGANASASDTPGEAALLVAAIVRRLERRIAWLASLDNRAADQPEEEGRWQATSEPGRLLSAAVEQGDAALAAKPESRFAGICRCFALLDEERDLLMTALAAQIDPALLALFSQISGRPWTTEPLVTRLFGHGHRLLWRPDGPLARWRLLLEGEAAPAEPAPLLPEANLAHWLAGTVPVDARLVDHLGAIDPLPTIDEWPVAEAGKHAQAVCARSQPVRLIIEARAGQGRAAFAAALAHALARDSFAVDPVPEAADWPLFWTLVQRHALVTGAVPVWRVPPPRRPASAPLAPLQAFCLAPGESLTVDEVAIDLRIALPPLGRDTRLHLLAQLHPPSAAWSEADRLRVADHPGLGSADLASLARAAPASAAEAEALLRDASAQALGDFAQRLPTSFEWDDLVVHPALRSGLEDFAYEARTRSTFWERGEMRRLFPGGRGLVALFAGPPGTGKTMAAQIIARDMGVDLYRIDLATLMSKYIGETARNMRDIFGRAAAMHAVLLFDEADALFANRTEVKDSHDRYANTDTNYLLQQLESFAGVAILASNRKTSIDTAFLRRIRYVYDFPRPDAADRKHLWHRLAPPILSIEAGALAPALDALGNDLELSGAQIKNALVAAHFATRRRGGEPSGIDLLKGVERELAKEGRSLSPRQRQRFAGHG